jgi:triosephosphate isomerase (TIM)
VINVPRTILAGNWKMHKTAAQARAFFEGFLPEAPLFPRGVEVVIAPPFTAIPAAHLLLHQQSRVALGAQNVHWEETGAYTGEISPQMLIEHGVSYAIIGHSERRAYCNELDRTVNLKVHALLRHGLTPIVAVGETLDEREAGVTDERVTAQTRAALDGVGPEQIANVVLAYEPIWAIGTGQNCDPAEANRVMHAIRTCVGGLDEVPILYGGSMKAENVAAYMEQENVNGGLVGGASLDASGFAMLIRNAAHA